MTRQPDWDIDFRRGQQGELFTDRIIQGLANGATEVKTDDRAIDTGNLFIETECLRGGAYLPSGLSETKAEFQAYVVGELFFAMPTERVKDMVRVIGRRAQCPNGSHPTRGWTISLTNVLHWMRTWAKNGNGS